MTYQHFGGDGYAASLAEAAFGVGMLVGSGVLIAWGGGKRLAGLIAVAAVIVGAATAACGFLPPRRLPSLHRSRRRHGRSLRLVQRPHHDAHPAQRARR